MARKGAAIKRPDDIPEDVWAAARDVDVVADYTFDGTTSGVSEEQETLESIARAILAARDRRRKS